MKCFALFGFSMIVSLLSPSVGRAEMVMFYVTTDKASYDPGEMVQWQILFDVGNSTSTTNFGVSALSVNLEDSFGNTLSTGVINKSTSPSFLAYDFSDAGTWDGPNAKLYEITVLEFAQSLDVVGRHGNQLNNILFASGSFTPTTAGMHTLLGSQGSTNTYFTAANQNFFAATTYESISFANATFNVTAVPEPSSILLLACTVSICGLVMRRNGLNRESLPSNQATGI
jgi:hypothetical protein